MKRVTAAALKQARHRRRKKEAAPIIRVAPPPPKPWELNAQEVELVKQHICPGASDLELQFNLTVARRFKLDPFRQQIWFVPRKSNNQKKWIPIVGINGLLHIAARDHSDFGSVGDPEYGPMIDVEWNVWKEVRGQWTRVETRKLSVPEWARAKVTKKGMTEPTVATVYWEEIYPNIDSSPMVRQMRRHMLGKCAVAHAIRRAYPSTDGLYISEEFAGQRPDYTREGREIAYPEPVRYDDVQKEAIEVLKSKGNWCEEHNCSRNMKHLREYHFDEIGTKPDGFADDRLQAQPQSVPTGGQPPSRAQSPVQRAASRTEGGAPTMATTTPKAPPSAPDKAKATPTATVAANGKPAGKGNGDQAIPLDTPSPANAPTAPLKFKSLQARLPFVVKAVKWTQSSKGLLVELDTGKVLHCYRNHKMGEDREELFNLLLVSPGKTCIFLTEESKFKDGKPFTQILRLLQMGDREWDESGMPVLRREPATKPQREPGDDAPEEWLK